MTGICSMDKTFGSFYHGKTILVTGHTGFKGAWLSLWLKKLGANVIGFSLAAPTEPNLFGVLDLEHEITHIEGDVRDLEKLKKVMEEYQPVMIFHLAAQSLVRKSYDNPIETYSTNVMGTLNVFEAARTNSCVKGIINVTSDKCYENKEWYYGYRENDPLGGYDPYSASKGCSEVLTSSYRSSFFNPEKHDQHGVSLASVRAGNVIGGGDWASDRLIPDCARFLSQNKTINIRNPHATRPWEFVLEPLSGYLWLGVQIMKKGKEFAQAWNFGPYDEAILSVAEVVNKFIQFWGNGIIELDNAPKPHEAEFLKLDISKAMYRLQWKPSYSIFEALSETVQWYKEYYSFSADMKSLSLEQINKYSETARKKGIIWAV